MRGCKFTFFGSQTRKTPFIERHAALSSGMKRIMIIGSPGSGKSTLARQLGEYYDLPVFHMDREVTWLPGWVNRAEADKTPIIQRIIAGEAWVFEGGHSKSYAIRLARADLLIWLDFRLPVRLLRVLGRTWRDRGQARADLQDECPERLSMLPEFIWYIVSTRKSARRKQEQAIETAICKTLHFKRTADLEQWRSNLH